MFGLVQPDLFGGEPVPVGKAVPAYGETPRTVRWRKLVLKSPPTCGECVQEQREHVSAFVVAAPHRAKWSRWDGKTEEFYCDPHRAVQQRIDDRRQ